MNDVVPLHLPIRGKSWEKQRWAWKDAVTQSDTAPTTPPDTSQGPTMEDGERLWLLMMDGKPTGVGKVQE